MRIMLVATGLGIGGAERVTVGLADGMAARGHEVLLVILSGRMVLHPASPSVRVVCLGMSKNVRSIWGGCRQLRRLIEEFCPDVLNSHMYHANIITRIVGLGVSCGKISSAHATNEEGRARYLVYRVTNWAADVITNVSSEAATFFEERRAAPSGTIEVMYNGVDTSVYRNDTISAASQRSGLLEGASGPLILAVGGLREAKDYPNLFRAFRAVVKVHPGAVLVVAGDGPDAEAVKLAASQHVSVSAIRFLGAREDVPSLMCACDVFVLSSAWEGFGLVVAEAMACERVVVATDCGGVREVIGDAGILVPRRDSVALANGILQALAMSPDERLQLGREARSRVLANFNLEQQVTQWEALYQRVASR